jgi:uncharacterized oligopeptide transporter (OPT) family protein
LNHLFLTTKIISITNGSLSPTVLFSSKHLEAKSVGSVRKSAYRQPLTPDGIRKIENGELKWFDIEMFSNLNTGVLEQYLDEKNRKEGFERSKFVWSKVAIGISIGLCFAIIEQYIGLKIGLVTSGAMYVIYLLGMSLHWSPTDINVASGGTSGAYKTCTGFVFTFPAIFLLAYSTRYVGYGGERLVEPGAIGVLLPIVLVSAILAAFLGVLYFIIFRRIWLVEDPLPAPQFQAQVKLLDIANDIKKGTMEYGKRSIRLVRNWTLLIMGLAFLREFPIIVRNGVRVSILDSILGSPYYAKGVIHMSNAQSQYTHLGYAFQGFGIAIGWFQKTRIALLITIGSLFTWLVVVPMIVAFEVPIYVPYINDFMSPLRFPEQIGSVLLLGANSPAQAADLGIAKLIAIGAILGGGLTALVKMLPTFKTVLTDLRGKSGSEKTRKDWVPKKGWYEWPVSHIKPMMIITAVGIGLIFWLGGFPILQSFVFSILLVAITFVLGAIAVKVGGEVGTVPVSGTSFLCLLLLVLVFGGLNAVSPFRSQGQLVIMALIGTTVFGSAISLSSDIIWEFKVGIYSGTRPFHIMKSELTGIFFGTFVSASAAIFFSSLLAQGRLELEAPQANAFATFTQILMGGRVMYTVFAMGVVVGVFIELVTGLGTAFGLGMYLPLSYTLSFLVGGASRDLWEKKWLEPKAKANNWSEREKTLKLLDTYMAVTGLLVGEALIGVFISIFLVFSG